MNDTIRPLVAVAEGAFASIDEMTHRFAPDADIRVGRVDGPASVAELTAGADALVVTLHPLRAAEIAALAPSVKVIVRAGVGLDTIDLDAARERGVRVVFQPMYATNEVADQAAALALASWRRVATADRGTREDGWPSVGQIGRVHALHESTLGVVGTGRIGRALIERLRPFVARVVVFDAYRDDSLVGVEWAESPAEVFAQANLLSLHVPFTPETRHLVDAAALASMPAGAVVVNVSRGGLIDESALAAALHSGHIGAAGLDVTEVEPLPQDSPLRAAPHLLLTPHMAWYSEESGQRLAAWSLQDAIAFARSGAVERGAFAWS